MSSETTTTYASVNEIAEMLTNDARSYYFYAQANIVTHKGVYKHNKADLGAQLNKDIDSFEWGKIRDILNSAAGELDCGDVNGAKCNRDLTMTIYMGDKGSFTPFHWDMHPAILGHSVGHKCFIFVPPNDNNMPIMNGYALNHRVRRHSKLKPGWYSKFIVIAIISFY